MSKQKYPQTASITSSDGNVITRKHRANYSQVKAHAKQDRKRHEAYKRQDAYDLLTIQEKMKHAGKKELAKLRKRLAAQTPPQVKVAHLTVAQKTAKTLTTIQDAIALMPKTKKGKTKQSYKPSDDSLIHHKSFSRA